MGQVSDMWLLFAISKLPMMGVNVSKLKRIPNYLMVLSALPSPCLLTINHLSLHENFSLCIGVFVQSLLCWFSFPYMEISNPRSIIAGIHQEPQFACLLGSVTQRGTACNCLSHHWQKKFWKAIAPVTTLMFVARKRHWGMGERLSHLCCIYIVLLKPGKQWFLKNV